MSRAVEELNRRMLRARDAMDRAYAEPLDVPALAGIAHVSEAHFIRTFRATFGETPHRYLQRRRVERAMELLRETGPMAVSSANRSGQLPATTADEAREQLGDAVTIYLDGGPSGEPVPSSIVDLTGDAPVLLRAGAIDVETLRSVVPDLVLAP